MAYAEMFPIVCATPGCCLVAGSFGTNGASDVDPDTVNGNGFTVARTNTGEYTVTLARRYTKIISLLSCIQKNATDNIQTEILGDGGQSGATLKIQLNTIGGADADLASNANNRVHFALIAQEFIA